MFEHFFHLILHIFVGQTPKYSAVCFKTDCAIYCFLKANEKMNIKKISQ